LLSSRENSDTSEGSNLLSAQDPFDS
jgi:hypothetical protein